MRWEQKIQDLATRARAEQVPRVDVTAGVLRILTAAQAPPATAGERLWMWLAAGSAAVAAPAAIIAGVLYRSSAGPLREIIDSIVWAMV